MNGYAIVDELVVMVVSERFLDWTAFRPSSPKLLELSLI